MPWLYALLAAAAFAVAFRASSVTLVIICLLVACVATLAAALGWLAQRVASRSRDESSLVDAVELQRLREQAEARRLAAAAESTALGDARR
ncbi:hypothetical protein [Cognatilysobacter bugurensis]|uniref:Uncharacterized protein n=1 Tax=Cognatilysobacter bugurensis TaxID=543356 RepID=A0A918W9Y3_9GAMM|nr:hypothetical protein [Lysobacter bugurensis]GHA87056.1 hypothetical protein GCM10007067_26120 [Lysobacter bugurensis]